MISGSVSVAVRVYDFPASRPCSISETNPSGSPPLTGRSTTRSHQLPTAFPAPTFVIVQLKEIVSPEFAEVVDTATDVGCRSGAFVSATVTGPDTRLLL